MSFKRLTRLLEFVIAGVMVGLIEDVIAIFFATDAEITPHVILIAFIVAVPFAFVNEFIVDHPNFWKFIFNRKDEVDTDHPREDTTPGV